MRVESAARAREYTQMDIYADLPSAKPSSDVAVASPATAAASASPASKGSWAHSKFQGMIANRRTAKAVSVCCCVLFVEGTHRVFAAVAVQWCVAAPEKIARMQWRWRPRERQKRVRFKSLLEYMGVLLSR